MSSAVAWVYGKNGRKGASEKDLSIAVEGNRGRARPRRRWMNGVKDCLNDRGLGNHSGS